jgi:hypothetical protein
VWDNGGMKKTTNYEEGRAAALERLQRLLGGRGEVSSEVTYFVLREEAGWWRRLLLQHLDADTPALPWLAYSRGGLDVVESIWSEHVVGGQPLARLAA